MTFNYNNLNNKSDNYSENLIHQDSKKNSMNSNNIIENPNSHTSASINEKIFLTKINSNINLDSDNLNNIHYQNNEIVNEEIFTYKNIEQNNKELNSNYRELKNKIKNTLSFEDLDEISFPDKVKMRSVSVSPEIPRLDFNFNFNKNRNKIKENLNNSSNYMKNNICKIRVICIL